MKIIKAIRNKFKKSSKISGVIVSGRDEVIWPERDYENFCKEAYTKNSISYTCIDRIAKAISSVNWVVQNTAGEKPETDQNHPINKLLKRPNPGESWTFLMIKLISYLKLSGNSYIERVAPDTGLNKGIPRELYVHRPDRMKILADTDKGFIKAFEYEVNGRKIKWETDPITLQADILQFKEFHPLDDWYGLAPVEPAAREIDTSNTAKDWNKKLLDNEARPGMIFSIVGNLTDSQFARLKAQMNEKHSGAENAGKSLIIEGETGTKAEPYGWSPKDMDFLEGGREQARAICNAFGVPPMLIGIPGDNTYSNYKEARAAFWEDTVIPLLSMVKGELNNWLFEDKEFTELDYDLDNVPALELRREARWDRTEKADFLTVNEKREVFGFDNVEGGDEVYIPAMMIPISSDKIGDEGIDISDEEGKQIEKLIESGYTKEQAEEILGLVGN